MSRPQWKNNSPSLFGPGASGKGSGLFGDPGLEIPDQTFSRLSISRTHDSVSMPKPQLFDPLDPNANESDKDTIRGMTCYLDLFYSLF